MKSTLNFALLPVQPEGMPGNGLRPPGRHPSGVKIGPGSPGKRRTAHVLLTVAVQPNIAYRRVIVLIAVAVRETTSVPRTRVRILLVDDFEPWRQSARSMLKRRAELQLVGEVADGLEAVQKASELKPDLILLDIGLPNLNGIEAAKQIRQLVPDAKILFLTLINDPDVPLKALSSGGHGYVLKSDAGSELLPAIEAVLQGKQYVSARLIGHDLTYSKDEHTTGPPRSREVLAPHPPRNVEVSRRHEVAFYPDDASLVDGSVRFIEDALRIGSAVIVVATESHRDSLLHRLWAHGLDIGAAIEQGRYIALDAAATLLTFMVSGMPDPVRVLKSFGDLIVTAAAAAKGEQARVAIFGECVHLLWAQGNAEAAIQVEQLCNQLLKTCDLDILCGYSMGSVQGGMDADIFQRICAEHSAVHGQASVL